LETELNLDPDPKLQIVLDPAGTSVITDPDPKLQTIPDPAGSGSTTLVATVLIHERINANCHKGTVLDAILGSSFIEPLRNVG
jgi:hypothetical protein